MNVEILIDRKYGDDKWIYVVTKTAGSMAYGFKTSYMPSPDKYPFRMNVNKLIEMTEFSL